MNINQVLQQYDSMFGNYTLDEIEQFLFQKLVESLKSYDNSSAFTLLNEMIGFCRDTMQTEKGLSYCQSLLTLMNKMNMQGAVEYATSLLNIANAYRAFGKYEESLQFFRQTFEIYQQNIERTSFSYASLFNNWSLLYQEMSDFQKAKDTLLLALEVVNQYPEAKIQQAITMSNLAATMLEIGDEQNRIEALLYVQKALHIFEEDGGVDFHYGAALVAMGDVHYKNENFVEAAKYYQKGLIEVEKHVGRNDNYVRVYEKYQSSVEQCIIRKCPIGWISNIERSRLFYESFGKKMIHEQFPEYETRIAVGMVGEGSDCFGFDDYISTDHDYEIGFCMWLTDEDYEKIGAELQQAYENLLHQYGLIKPNNRLLANRRGVHTINDFYANREEEYLLAEATNGCVFVDELGVFRKIREQLLSYYPKTIWYQKIAKALHDFSQYAQSNYPRMMSRQDLITASLCRGKAVESAMDIVYLLNRVYAPYYKWKRKGLEQLSILQEVVLLLEELVMLPSQAEAWDEYVYVATKINEKDEVVVTFEKIAKLILDELVRQGIVSGTDSFLELYVTELMEG